MKKADLNILKLDSAIEDTLHKINCPRGKYRLTDIIHSLGQIWWKNDHSDHVPERDVSGRTH